jgi:hypothetical protein
MGIKVGKQASRAADIDARRILDLRPVRTVLH